MSIGGIRRRPAQAELLDRERSWAVLDRYRDEHPMSWEFLRRAIEEDGRQDPATVPVVVLRLFDPDTA